MTPSISALVVKIAERCNLNCAYCYLYQHGDDSWRTRPKFMSAETFEALLHRARAYCDQERGRKMVVCFHGGEPLLVGKTRLVEMARRTHAIMGDRLGRLALQTNAVLVDPEWVSLFQEHQIGVSVSLDGPAAVHDRVRVDHAGRGSHGEVVRGLKLLQAGDVLRGVLCVVDPEADGLAAYRHFRALGMEKIQFLIPDVSRDSRDAWYGHLGHTPVADYLLPIFDAWFAENDPKVRLEPFWSLLTLMSGGRRRGDGFGGPSPYLVIESDGAIQPLDVLRICRPDLINTGLNVHDHHFDAIQSVSPFLHQFVHEGLPLSDTCRACSEVEVCGGGYPPHRFAAETGFANPSAWCADLKKIIEHVRVVTGLAHAV